MFAQSEAMYLPLVIVAVSEQRSVRPPSKRSKAATGSTRAPRSAGAMRRSRASRVAASVRTNIVRLVPGQTQLPFEPTAR